MDLRLPRPPYHSDDDDSTVSGYEQEEGVSESTAANPKGDSEQKKQEAELGKFTKTEDNAVFWLRMVLVAVLLVSAVGCAVLIYLYSNNEEEKAYSDQLESDAQKLFESIGTNLENTMAAADAFMFQIISQAKSTNSVWPFITIPDLPVKAAKLISQTDSMYMTFYPLITGAQRGEWENFTMHHDNWVEDSLEVQSRNPHFHGPILDEYPVSHSIWRNEGPESYEDNEGPFLPSWMGSPVIPYYYPYNWNALAYEAFAKALVAGMETKSVVVTAVANNADPNDPAAVTQAATTSDWARPYIDADEDPNEPFADMYYPVIDSIDDVLIKVDDDTQALGSVAFSFYWRHTLQNALPPNSKGVVIVFENPCGNQVFTYQVDGKLPTFLGFQDLHDRSYDDQATTRNLTSLTNTTGMYTGLPLHDEFCPYQLTVYPSSHMKDHYMTKDPIIYSIVVALVFFFTSLLFLSYDWFVHRRQKLIKQRAMASGAIVRSLFPEQVRGQLYQDNLAVSKMSHGTSTEFRASSTMMDSSKTNGGSPNAHLYVGTSIFFADLVGFTKWSSTRSPEQVFLLLETLYGEFDKIAARRSVFKVETIGDCYVAATGIPNAQPHHAVKMVKFAQECLEKVHAVTQELAGRLGEDTMDLAMRVGVNSGNTTAGVLRGVKGRFQLFGDTVNTAARMESNGVKNRIQVSQATADELIQAGRGSWLIPREEKVVAKGKGEIKTYFVAVTRKIKSTSSDLTDPMIGECRSSISDSRKRRSPTVNGTSSMGVADLMEVLTTVEV